MASDKGFKYAIGKLAPFMMPAAKHQADQELKADLAEHMEEDDAETRDLYPSSHPSLSFGLALGGKI